MRPTAHYRKLAPMAHWFDQAECRNPLNDPIWFDGETEENINRAKRICIQCPVRIECGQYAIANDERHSIWGGMTPDQRKGIWK